MCRNLVPQLVELSPDAIILMVTNPVDVLTYAAQKFAGLPRERVFGSGTVLDSSRLRILLARHAGVAVQSVHAYVVGEHGDSELPLWSTATIGPIPVADWSVPGAPPLDAEVRDGIAHQVVTAAERIIRGKGATNYAVGLATARIVEAVLKDERRILPVSSLLDGQYGLHDVCLSLPTVVDRRGIVSVLAAPVSDHELEALTRSAAAVRSVASSLGL